MRRIFAIAGVGLGILASAVAQTQPAYAPLTEEAKVIAAAAMEAFEKGNFANARLQFEKMRAVSPGHPMPLINLGTIAFQSGRLKDSAELLEEATRLDPGSAQGWTLLGMVRVYQDKPDEALAALSRAVLLAPENAKVHNYLGVAIGRKRWLDGAESELRQAIALDPKYADAQFNLALIYLQRDPPNQALAERHYRSALQLGAPPDLELEKKLKN